MYKLLILAPAETSPSLKKLAVAIRSQFSSLKPPNKISTSLRGGTLTVKVNQFRFFIGFSCEPHVLQESQDIAERFAAQHPARAAIAAASCRFELSSGRDPQMDHFNDMIFICHAAEAIGPVYIFDPRAKEFT
jgi:hypothetical protein